MTTRRTARTARPARPARRTARTRAALVVPALALAMFGAAAAAPPATPDTPPAVAAVAPAQSEAHGSLCTPRARTPFSLYRQVAADGYVWCPADAHNSFVEARLEIWKDIPYRPDRLINYVGPVRGGGPGRNLPLTTTGSCAAGAGKYYGKITYKAFGAHGWSIPRSHSSLRVYMCMT